jgi:3-phenylpropionate/trans-cinnamate dioxygenase ferredoxin reductase component
MPDFTAPDRIVVLGAGQAGAQAVDALRRRGFKGALTLIGAEDSLPYQRPPLSKKYLAGALEQSRLLLRHAAHYVDEAVDLRLGRRAVSLDRQARRVHLDDGAQVAYDALLFATGSRPLQLKIPGADLQGVYYVRTIADVDALRAACSGGRRLVIIGGGYIGLEVAATCHELGLEVTVLEMAERVMKRVVAAEISAFYEAEHARRGVRIVCNARVREILGHSASRSVRAVLCDDGSEYAADLVVIGVGVVPETELAVAAGIECSNGIVVDEHCRTSDPHVYAAGDCSNLPSVHFGGRVRLESVDNAVEQSRSAALNMLGDVVVHDRVPWFWSDQYDLKLITVGLSAGHDTRVMRGDVASRSFSVCYLRDGQLVAVDTVNRAKDQMAARKLVAARVRPSATKLADAALALSDCT